MSGFPINLDLTVYFDDLRKHSSVFVNLSKCKDVGDVENHIKSVFKLEDNICLANKKFLIPKSEEVQILQQYEIFKVQKCDFYDTQIHKTKKPNSTVSCDQKALNLTQSEKTIDLSCRPKQRIKTNNCVHSCVSGPPTPLVDKNNCLESQLRPSSSESAIADDTNHVGSKEKKKHKKKRHLQNEETDCVGNDNNILDMSVKKSKTHLNCVLMEGISCMNESVNDIDHIGTSKELNKKSKKGKKHFNVDPQHNHHELENRMEFHNNTGDEECSTRKKRKHSTKSFELRGYQETHDNVLSSSSPLCCSENRNSNNNTLKYVNDKDFDSSKSLDEHKQKINVQIDKIINQIPQNGSDTNSHSKEEDKEFAVSSIEPASPNSDNSVTEGTLLQDENQQTEINSELANVGRRKRKRKHNKKQKRERLMYMTAVGPALNQLADLPPVTRPPPSEMGKHVFFTEGDFAEEMKIPPTPPKKFQTTQVETVCHSNHTEMASTPATSCSNPGTWQDKLLGLASASQKPVVFHRSTPDRASSSKADSSQQHSTLDMSVENPAERSCQDELRGAVVEASAEVNDFRRCNGEVKTETVNVETGSAHNSTNGLPDIIRPRPVPNALQSINLANYPIIDRVVQEDLIVFKVLKLNENNEPEVSNSILARVNESSNFPDKISLQVMEGCEECDGCRIAGVGEGDIVIEIQWADILEPRLFYP